MGIFQKTSSGDSIMQPRLGMANVLSQCVCTLSWNYLIQCSSVNVFKYILIDILNCMMVYKKISKFLLTIMFNESMMSFLSLSDGIACRPTWVIHNLLLTGEKGNWWLFLLSDTYICLLIHRYVPEQVLYINHMS